MYHYIKSGRSVRVTTSFTGIAFVSVLSATPSVTKDPHFLVIWGEFGIGYRRKHSTSSQNMEQPSAVDRSTLPSEIWEEIILQLSPFDILLMRLVILAQLHGRGAHLTETIC